MLNAKTKLKFLCLPYTKQTILFFTEKEFIRKVGRIEPKQKEGFLTVITTTIKKDPTTLIRKHKNELKVLKKTVKTAIKQDLSPDHNPTLIMLCDVSENKTNATSHPNIGLLKTAI